MLEYIYIIYTYFKNVFAYQTLEYVFMYTVTFFICIQKA